MPGRWAAWWTGTASPHTIWPRRPLVGQGLAVGEGPWAVSSYARRLCLLNAPASQGAWKCPQERVRRKQPRLACSQGEAAQAGSWPGSGPETHAEP